MSGGPMAEPRERAAYNRLLRGVERIAATVRPGDEDSFAEAVHQLMARWRGRTPADRRRLLAIMATCTISHCSAVRDMRQADRGGQ